MLNIYSIVYALPVGIFLLKVTTEKLEQGVKYVQS